MLRLCHGLNRHSVDLDFWIVKKPLDIAKLFKGIKTSLSAFYALSDAANKYHTLLFELRSKIYPRSLKIEIRKEIRRKIETEKVIAYSKHTTIQVLLTALSLKDMMLNKIECFMTRKEIRDVFDIEFLVKKGIALPDEPSTLSESLKLIEGFTKKDYTVKLGSILERDQRKYYIAENFKILKAAINDKIKGE
jgi:predicted nucleotidyltransferase component of viral defense system